MKIITALGNPMLNENLINLKKYEIIAPDIQYKEGIIELLKEGKKVDLIILSEILPGEINIQSLIKSIKDLDKKIKIIIFLEERKEELENFLIAKGVFDIFYNNEININDIVKVIDNKETDKEKIDNQEYEDEIIINLEKLENQKELKENISTMICIAGNSGSGKSIIAFNLAMVLKKRDNKILLIDLGFNSTITYMLNIKKNKNEENSIIKINSNIDLYRIKKDDRNPQNENKMWITDIEKLKKHYNFIIVDMRNELNNSEIKNVLLKSDEIIFLLEPNLIEIKKSEKILDLYLNEWRIEKDKIKILFNKYTKNSIDINILKKVFSNFKIAGVLNFNDKYNILINKKVKIVDKKIEREYEKIIKNVK